MRALVLGTRPVDAVYRLLLGFPVQSTPSSIRGADHVGLGKAEVEIYEGGLVGLVCVVGAWDVGGGWVFALEAVFVLLRDGRGDVCW